MTIFFEVELSRRMSFRQKHYFFDNPFFFFTQRGVGCIFVEMISGFPVFPGVKSARDQLSKIFKVTYFL